MRLFKNRPAVSISSSADDVGLVIATGDLKTVLQGRAPATGITVMQKVDYSISKSLKKDFIVDTFGDSPVHIVLDGVTIMNAACLENGEQASTMEDFYEKYKLSANKANRVSLGLSGHKTEDGVTTNTFKCVLLSMRSMVDEKEAKQSTIRYQLEFLGVVDK